MPARRPKTLKHSLVLIGPKFEPNIFFKNGSAAIVINCQLSVWGPKPDVYIYIYIHVNMHIYIYIYMYMYMYIKYIFIYLYVYVYHIYIYI